MLRPLCVIRLSLVVWLLALSSAFAQAPQRSALEELANNIGKTMYAIAWPTATYSGVRYGSASMRGEDIALTFRLFGKSALDGDVLWTDATVLLRNGGVIDFEWGDNNAVVSKPGATAKIFLEGVKALNAELVRRSQAQGNRAPGPRRGALSQPSSYRDQSGLMSFAVSPGYALSYERSGLNAQGHLVTTATFAAADAQHDGSRGWLSDGVRVTVVRPPQGNTWLPAYRSEWASNLFDQMVGGYDKSELMARKPVSLAGMTGSNIAVLGYSNKLREAEATYLYILTSPWCLVSVEVVSPLSKDKTLETLRDTFFTSFKAACAE